MLVYVDEVAYSRDQVLKLRNITRPAQGLFPPAGRVVVVVHGMRGGGCLVSMGDNCRASVLEEGYVAH